MLNWLLPEYVSDILPAEAQSIERLRRRVLDLFAVHGYELVIPPMLEYVDSLLTGTGHDLDLRTFKLVDQISGRMLGIRADITPQVARMDAHLLNRQGLTRLCYVGRVLHTLPSDLTQTREPLQMGAEIYGHQGVESDIEVQRLLLRSMSVAGVTEASLDLGHVRIFRTLVRNAHMSEEQESELFHVMQLKDVPALRALVKKTDKVTREALIALPDLYGASEVLSMAAKRLPPLKPIKEALKDLNTLYRGLGDLATIRFDLAELRGYHYHSGVVFSAYAKGWNNALARGGRYDEVGRAFGRARAATGFSMDLRELASAQPAAQPRQAILAPYKPKDALLQARIESLRGMGKIVIVDLPGHVATRQELACTQRLLWQESKWVLVKI
jgi:ATP phosphoribosyltransferase regulatory subunit